MLSKPLVLILVSCLLWAGIIAVAIVVTSGITISTGWVVAGAAILFFGACLVVMAREYQQAIELPDSFATADTPDRELSLALEAMGVHPRTELHDKFYEVGRGRVPDHRGRPIPHKVRSNQP